MKPDLHINSFLTVGVGVCLIYKAISSRDDPANAKLAQNSHPQEKLSRVIFHK
jgi:hypothetical protein